MEHKLTKEVLTQQQFSIIKKYIFPNREREKNKMPLKIL